MGFLMQFSSELKFQFSIPKQITIGLVWKAKPATGNFSWIMYLNIVSIIKINQINESCLQTNPYQLTIPLFKILFISIPRILNNTIKINEEQQ